MTVRYATEADLTAILDIYNEAILTTTATADYEPHTLEMRADWYAERVAAGYAVFVAEEEGRVVGWSALNPYKARIGYRYTAEVSIYVAADSRGRGVGRALLPPLITAAREQGLHSLVAAIDGNNEMSLRLHARYGFETVGRLRETYTKFDRWHDVVYMQLLLD